MYGDMLAYLHQNSKEFQVLVLQHIKISGFSVFMAILIGVPLGILSARSQKLYHAFSGFFGLLRVIPSLAILIICIPIMGVGIIPATLALTLLAIPPVLINTALGFRSLPESVLETALGMGMDTRRVFLEVKLPLAMPLILTGIRTSSVEVIASATLAAYIGAGGLGNIIFTGLGLYRMDLLFLGGLSVAALSLIADMLFFLLEWHMTKYQRN